MSPARIETPKKHALNGASIFVGYLNKFIGFFPRLPETFSDANGARVRIESEFSGDNLVAEVSAGFTFIVRAMRDYVLETLPVGMKIDGKYYAPGESVLVDTDSDSKIVST